MLGDPTEVNHFDWRVRESYGLKKIAEERYPNALLLRFPVRVDEWIGTDLPEISGGSRCR